MEIGDVIEYFDGRGNKWEATIRQIIKQPRNINDKKPIKLINLEYIEKAQFRRAELCRETPGLDGAHYGKVLKKTEQPEKVKEAPKVEETPKEETVVTETATETSTATEPEESTESSNSSQ